MLCEIIKNKKKTIQAIQWQIDPTDVYEWCKTVLQNKTKPETWVQKFYCEINAWLRVVINIHKIKYMKVALDYKKDITLKVKKDI